MPDKNYIYLDITLGEDEYFFLGDNINNSYDSRYFGPIKKENIIGEAYFLPLEVFTKGKILDLFNFYTNFDTSYYKPYFSDNEDDYYINTEQYKDYKITGLFINEKTGQIFKREKYEYME